MVGTLLRGRNAAHDLKFSDWFFNCYILSRTLFPLYTYTFCTYCTIRDTDNVFIESTVASDQRSTEWLLGNAFTTSFRVQRYIKTRYTPKKTVQKKKNNDNNC